MKYFLKESLKLKTGDGTKTDEFSEKVQTALDPPPSFWDNHIAFFLKYLAQKAPFKGPISAI